MSENITTVLSRDKILHSPSAGSMVALKDGSIMLVWSDRTQINANYSSDNGKTWTDPKALSINGQEGQRCGFGTTLIRLASGKLGLIQPWREAGKGFDEGITKYYVSSDEGQSWSKGVPIHREGDRIIPFFDQCIQLKSGRLVIPVEIFLGPTPSSKKTDFYMQFGEKFRNTSGLKVALSFACYSDDEGQSWHRSQNEVHATLDRGMGGAYFMVEPVIAELTDGRIIMIARTLLGCAFVSYSEDNGETWLEAEPSDLNPRPESPMSLKKIPGTGDLLAIWNQISSWETFNGLYRHRLTCSISQDNGLTFTHHKNLESLDDVNRLEKETPHHGVAPAFPVRLENTELWNNTEGSICATQPMDRVRYHRAPGPLRNDHPFCTFKGNDVIIAYSSGVLGDPNAIIKTYGMNYREVLKKFDFEINAKKTASVFGVNKVFVAPIDWLYI